MDDIDDPPRSAGLWRWLDASRAEVAGLAVLLLGAVAATAVLWWSARPGETAAAILPTPSAAATRPVPSPSPTSVTVHVAGEVAAPGVVVLASGSRVRDAIAAAGGATPRADLTGVNLARPLVDGEQILVPREGGTIRPAATPSAAAAVRPDGRLDLNLATTVDLEQLPGVGPVLAGRIVAWRDSNGGFTEVEQLRDVSGIGDATFAELEPLVAV